MFLKKINLFVYDFDGVMTNNKVLIDQNGHESVFVSRADGLGVSEIKKLGIDQIIISTEKNHVVSARAKKLKIKCLQGINRKKSALLEYCKKNRTDLDQVAFVGNDLNDMEVMEIAGYTLCPSDAHESIKKISDYILETKGGEGVIRELFELITTNK